MKKIQLFGVVAMFLTLVSCNSQKSENSQKYLEESSNVKRLLLDSGTNIYEGMNFYVDSNDVAYITVLNTRPGYYIDFYRLDSCCFTRRLFIDVQKNNLSSLQTHAVTSTGDIYVGNALPPCVCKLDNNGDVFAWYDFTEVEGVARTHLATFFSMDNYKPIVTDKGKVVCPLEYTQYLLGVDVDRNDVPVALLIDTATSITQRTSLVFPDLYKGSEVMSSFKAHSRVFDGEKYVYSFEEFSNLFVTTDFKTFNTIDAESRLIGEVNNEPLDGTNHSDNEFANASYTKAEYGSVIFDEYRDVFYRLCYAKSKKSEDIDLMNMEEYRLSKGDFSIQIFDKELNLLGETMFEAGKYAPRIFFLDKDGLWLSENNVFRDDISEDELVFRCLELKNSSN